MISCNQCQKPNTLDGSFCRGCGHALDADALHAARLANEELIGEGFKLLSDGRYEEARMVAETAAATDPSSAQAHSLKADALERDGDLAGAVSAFERALELSPDSTLDRIKLAHLKKVLAERTQIVSKPNRRNAALAGLAATLLVASIGAGAAYWKQTQDAQNAAKANVGTSLPLERENSVAMNDQPTPNPAQTPSTNESKPEVTNPDPKPTTDPKPASETDTAAPPRTPRENPGTAVLPNPASGNSDSVRPLSVPGNINVEPVNPPVNNTTTRPNPANANDPDPTPSIGGGTTAQPDKPTTPTKPPTKPVIDIRPSEGNPTQNGGSETVPDRPATKSTRERARESMLAGKFEEAVGLFREALAQGADPGINNQYLGSCLERLNRKGEAIQAYKRALDAYQKRIASGDDSARTKSAAETCRLAIQNLGG